MAQWQGLADAGLLVAAALNVPSPRTLGSRRHLAPQPRLHALPRLPCRGFLFGIQL